MTTKPNSHRRIRYPHLRIANGRRKWLEEHHKKAVCVTEDNARSHLAQISLVGEFQYIYYQCRWGDSYEFGQSEPLHWHVGRRRGQP